MLNLPFQNVKDTDTRQSFVLLTEYINGQPILNYMWKFFTFTFTVGGTYTFPHNLGFTPKDALYTGGSPNMAFYIDFDACDSTNMSLVVGGAGTVRFLLGNLDTTSSA